MAASIIPALHALANSTTLYSVPYFGSGIGRWTDTNHWNTSAAAPRPLKHKTVGWIGIN
jgi:hypothetical protein